MLDERVAIRTGGSVHGRGRNEDSVVALPVLRRAFLLACFLAPLIPSFAWGIQLQVHGIAIGLCSILALAALRHRERQRSLATRLRPNPSRRPIVLREVELGLLAIFGATLCSIPFAQSLSSAIAALFPLLALGAGYLLCRRFVRRAEDVEDVTLAFLLAGTVLAWFGIGGAVAFESALRAGRAIASDRTAWLATSLYPHSYAVAQFLAPCVPLGLALLLGTPSRRYRIAAWIALPSLATYLLLVLSRAMWAATALGCAVVLIAAMRARRGGKRFDSFLFGAVVLGCGAAWLLLGDSALLNVRDRLTTLLDPQALSFNFSRFGVWGDALRLASESMPFGVGIGDFPRRFAEIDSSRRFIPHAHQQFLHWLVEIGPVGCVGLILSLLSAGWMLLRRLAHPDPGSSSLPVTRGLLGAWLTFAVISLTETPLLYASDALFFALLLAAARRFGTDSGRKLVVARVTSFQPVRVLKYVIVLATLWFALHATAGVCGTRARSAAAAEEHERAIALASFANTLQPHLDWILWIRAQSERALGRLQDAEQTLSRYDQKMPRVTAAQMHLATIAFQNGHQDDALARLFAARKRAAPEFLVEIDYEIGNCLTYLGRDEEARVVYLDLIEAGAHLRYPDLLRRTAECLSRLERDPTLVRALRAQMKAARTASQH